MRAAVLQRHASFTIMAALVSASATFVVTAGAEEPTSPRAGPSVESTMPPSNDVRSAADSRDKQIIVIPRGQGTDSIIIYDPCKQPNPPDDCKIQK